MSSAHLATNPATPWRVVVMGVSGSGKTAVGRRVADALGCAFVDGDDHHPAANIEKMASGVPLNDADRQPWLETLHGILSRAGPEGGEGDGVVIACSALKARYRETLRGGLTEAAVRWLYLRGEPETLARRLGGRQGHFMPPALLQSQLDTLEEPAGADVINVEPPLDEVVEACLAALLKSP